MTHLERPRPLRSVGARLALLALCLTSLFGTSGCRVIEGIFKAGVWVGVVAVVLMLAVVGGIATLVMKQR